MQTTWLTDRDMIICMAYLWGSREREEIKLKDRSFLGKEDQRILRHQHTYALHRKNK